MTYRYDCKSKGLGGIMLDINYLIPDTVFDPLYDSQAKGDNRVMGEKYLIYLILHQNPY